MSGTILVTGGNIGSYVVDGLREKGKEVRIAELQMQSNPVWKSAGVEQVEFDYSRPDALDRAFDGVEAYFFVSPFIQNLAEAGKQVVNAARRAGVKRIVRSSVLGADGNAATFSRWHRKDGILIVARGDLKASMVDARDIAAAGVVALSENGQESKKYKITGGEAVSNIDIADALSDPTGRSVQ